MKVLLTGFDPFAGERINPSFEAVRAISSRIAGAEIVKLELPTVFHESIRILEEAMERERPDLVICLGQAGGRSDISIERVAINISDASIEDNRGNKPIDQPIFEDGDGAYFSKLPIKAMVKEIRSIGLPASISNTAGTYVCNHIMYGLHYLIDRKFKGIRGGFIHVPFIPEQVVDKRNMPSMNMSDIVRALEVAVAVAVLQDQDIKEEGGATH